MKGAYSALYTANVVFQSIFTLLMHIGAGLLLSWLLVSKLELPSWLYAVVIVISVLSGFLSMVRFILSTMRALDNLEKQKQEKWRKNEKTK